MKICHNEPRSVSQVYSSDLRTLLVNMMAKHPEDRPSSAEIVAMPHVRRGIALLLKPEAARSIEAADAAMEPDGSPAAPLAPQSVGIGISHDHVACETPTGVDLEMSLSISDGHPAEPRSLQVQNSVSSLKQ